MKYCAETDPQAVRLHFILTSFRDVVVQHRTSITQSMDTNIPPPLTGPPQLIPLSNERNEPLDTTHILTSPPLTGMPPHLTPTSMPQAHQKPFAEPSISPTHHISSMTPLSSTLPSGGDYSHDEESPSGLPTPQSSWDPFLELSHVPSDKASDGTDSLLGDGEIEFDSLWQWPNHDGTGLMPTGANLTPGGTTLMPGGPLDVKAWPG